MNITDILSVKFSASSRTNSVLFCLKLVKGDYLLRYQNKKIEIYNVEIIDNKIIIRSSYTCDDNSHIYSLRWIIIKNSDSYTLEYYFGELLINRYKMYRILYFK